MQFNINMRPVWGLSSLVVAVAVLFAMVSDRLSLEAAFDIWGSLVAKRVRYKLDPQFKCPVCHYLLRRPLASFLASAPRTVIGGY